MCVRARTASPHSAHPVPEDAAASAGSGTLAHSEGLQGVHGCSRAEARALQTSRGPALSPEAARPSAGLLRILGSLARRQAGCPAAGVRGRLQRAEVGGGESAARKASTGNAENSPLPPLHATLPNQTPLPVSPAHLSAPSQNPEPSDSLQSRERGERGFGGESH